VLSSININTPLKLYKLKLILLLSVFYYTSTNAQVTDTTTTDSAENLLALPDTVKPLQSKFISFIPPAAFVGYGLLSLQVKAIRQVDYNVYEDMKMDHPNFHTKLDNFMQYAPVVSVYALNLAGVRGKNTFIDRSILLILSQAIMSGTTFALKGVTNRIRPDGSNKLSFPSGHTGNAFASAEFMAQEFGDRSPVYGIIGYSFATTTAILRVYNNKHWFSDIIAGAGFGILSTKAAYLIYPLFRNKLFRDKDGDASKSTSILMPTYQQGMAGFMFVKNF
jgi:hypothetical protein